MADHRQSCAFYQGLRLVAVDGTTLSAPDEKAVPWHFRKHIGRVRAFGYPLVRRVQIHVGGPDVVQGPRTERGQLGVQVGADPRDLALGDPAVRAKGLDQLIGRRVDTPWTNASIATANRAWSMRRRRSSRLGKKLPERGFGLASSRSPACVVSVLSRCPLCSAVRVSVCSFHSAPILALASASISSWSIRSVTERTSSNRPPHVVTPAGGVGQTGTGPPCTSRVELAVHQGELQVARLLDRERNPYQYTPPGVRPSLDAPGRTP